MQLKQAPTGLILYDGPSKLDGEPIVVIATLKSDNKKTGNMIQIWILRSDMNPVQAISTDSDKSICGDCVHRGNMGKLRSCYVNIATAPWQIYHKYKDGFYSNWDRTANFVKNRFVRIGAYGDPAAMPYWIGSFIARHSLGVTAYSHQWRICDSKYSNFCMASVESEDEALLAQSMGWRTFRVRQSTDSLMNREFMCPASEEAGKRLNCIDCLACSGTRFGNNTGGNVSIILHGSPMARKSYERKYQNNK